MSPQSDPGRNVDKLEVAGLALERFILGSVPGQLNSEKRVVMPAVIVLRPGREFLISGHQRRSDIVGQKESVRCHMEELDDVIVADDAATTGFGKGLGRDNAPVVIGVVVAISSDLLTLATDTVVVILKRVLVGV